MKRVLMKILMNLFAAAALCAALGACSTPNSLAGANFPTYGSQSAVSGQFIPPSIMDY